MSDFDELKKLAEAACGDDWSGAGASAFMTAANPAAVLALLKDLEVATSVGKALGVTLGNVVEGRDALALSVENLKAENEALRKDAERYRWLRSHNILAHVQVEQENGECPYVYAEELDRSIDEIRAFRND